MSGLVAHLRATREAFALDAELHAAPGDVVALLGPNGAGKTTSLRLLAGLLAPAGGSVVLDGTRLDGLPPEQRRVGLVPQDGLLLPHLSALDNVASRGWSAWCCCRGPAATAASTSTEGRGWRSAAPTARCTSPSRRRRCACPRSRWTARGRWSCARSSSRARSRAYGSTARCRSPPSSRQCASTCGPAPGSGRTSTGRTSRCPPR